MSESDYVDELLGEEAEAPQETQEEASQEEEPQGRANERIRQLVEEKNELRGQVEEQNRRIAAMESLKAEVEKLAAEREQKPEEPAPDFMEDPKGYVDTALAKQKEQMEALQEQAQSGSQSAQQQVAQIQFMQAIQGDEQAFVRDHPDYYDALNHVREIRKAELLDLGLNDQQAIQVINNEELQTAATGLQTGKSPAEAVYKRASRMGYAAKESESNDMDEQVKRMENMQRAGSMGGSGVPEDKASVDTPEDEAWAPIEEAFKEAWGEELH